MSERYQFDPATARELSRMATSSMSPEARTERAKRAAAARWQKEKGEDWTPPADDVALKPFYDIVDERWPALPPAARTIAAQAIRTSYGRGDK